MNEDKYLKDLRGGGLVSRGSEKTKVRGKQVKEWMQEPEDMKMLVEELKAAMEPRFEVIAEEFKVFRAELKCYNCGEAGHFSNKCPAIKKPKFENKETTELKKMVMEMQIELKKFKESVILAHNKLNEKVKKMSLANPPGAGRAVAFADGTPHPAEAEGRVVWIPGMKFPETLVAPQPPLLAQDDGFDEEFAELSDLDELELDEDDFELERERMHRCKQPVLVNEGVANEDLLLQLVQLRSEMGMSHLSELAGREGEGVNVVIDSVQNRQSMQNPHALSNNPELSLTAEPMQAQNATMSDIAIPMPVSVTDEYFGVPEVIDTNQNVKSSISSGVTTELSFEDHRTRMVEIENPKDVSNQDDSDSENLRIDEVGDGDKECVLSDDMEPVQKLSSFQPFKLCETFPQVPNARAVTRCTSDKPVLQRKITCGTPLRREKQKIQLTLKACVALFLKAKAVHADRCIQVLSNEEFWEFVAAILDSGATFDIGSLPIHGPYAKKIRKLAEPVYVTTASGANIAIEHVGTFEVRVNRPKGIYRFGSLEVYLVNSNDWQEMLIGESTLRAHGLMPDQTIDRILEVQQKYEVPISARSFNARMAKEVFGLKLGGKVEEDGDI